jgi:hypothetical protein
MISEMEVHMHFLTRIAIPNESGNKFIGSKDFSEKMDSLISNMKPEASYFCIANGKRTIYTLINVESSADLPKMVEPFWLTMNAEVEFIPAMTQQEFGKAMPGIKQSVDKYYKPQ